MSEFQLATIEEILEEARNGRPYILVDAPDRENEGDIILPAQFVTPRMINFMAVHARGLICLAMTGARARELGLPQMTSRNESGHGTAFTVSIEAREGVETGISAADRAHTIAVAVDSAKGANDIVSPGHVFPVVAQDGGVLVRAGHTEAAVDISRMAGLYPAGVICEVINEDGAMSRLPELLEFGRQHDLKTGSIADLIAYRRRSETLVSRVAETPFTSRFGGDFRLIVYRDQVDGGEHVALVRGAVGSDAPVLVRVHRTDIAADLLGWKDSPQDHIPAALRTLAAHDGPAVAVFVRDPNPQSISQRFTGGRTDSGEVRSLRDYGVGAQILRDLGVQRMILLTSSQRKIAALEGFGLSVIDRLPITNGAVA